MYNEGERCVDSGMTQKQPGRMLLRRNLENSWGLPLSVSRLFVMNPCIFCPEDYNNQQWTILVAEKEDSQLPKAGKDVCVMPAQSDMETIIKVAENYLDMELEAESSNINVYKHPFLFSPMIQVLESDDIQSSIPNSVHTLSPDGGHSKFIYITENPEALEVGREIIRARLRKCKSPFEIFFMMDKPYRLYFFALVKDILSAEDYAVAWRFAWVGSVYTNYTHAFTKKEIMAIFAACVPEYLMNEDEQEVFCNLPDELTIYRGVTKKRKHNVRVFSWTLSMECAKKFASMYCTTNGKIFQANINKEHIFAYFSGEDEIVVNPYKLKNITELEWSK